MTQFNFPIFYKAFGVRHVNDMIDGRVFTLSTMPKGSMSHFVSFDPEHRDIDTSKVHLGANARRAVIDFPEILSSSLGNARYQAVSIREHYKPFLKKNRKYRFVRDAYRTLNDDLTLLVDNYSYIDIAYTYPKVNSTAYFKWWNTKRTIFDRIAKICTVADKNHFVFTDLPDEIPSMQLLSVYSQRKVVDLVRIFNTPAKLFMLELFTWLGENRKDSNTIFSGIPEDKLSKVNIVVFLSGGRSSIINLGALNSWIKGNEKLAGGPSVQQVTNVQIQKVLVKYFLSLKSLQPEVVQDVYQDVNEVPLDPQDVQEYADIRAEQNEFDGDNDIQDDVVDSHEYQEGLSYAAPAGRKQPTDKHVIANVLDDKAIDSAFDIEGNLDDKLKSLDDDLKVLDEVTNRKLFEKGLRIEQDGAVRHSEAQSSEASLHEIQQAVYLDVGVEDVLEQQIETQVDYGLLSASDYRNLKRDMQVYNDSKDPYNSTKLRRDSMKIEPSDLLLSEDKTKIESSDLVQDKSMLQSSLLSFDQDYVSGVLKKDMLSTLHHIQKAGVLVKKHEVTVEHSALGSYEYHTLELKPVDGQSSTIRFKVPVINEDGTLVSNNIKMVLRKQRVDIPIRKIKPTEVALTSYYGKTFVKLNPKKANSSLEWIIKELNIASMSDTGFIKRVNPAKVFDNNFKAPFIYSALADNFKSIVTESFTLQFDRSDRASLVSEERLKALEINGRRLVGLTNDKTPIIVDNKNNFFIVPESADPVALGDIYSTLQLDSSKAPVDFCEVNVFSKSVPVAFVLGYTLGFKNLVKLLQVQYRTTEGREQKNMQPHEFAVQFKDTSYIFSRRDSVAASILAGYNDFEKQIRQFEADDFNHKDVYLNLLESKGLSSIYIREIDLMQQLFVDNITKEILEDMKEPVTFNGLLLRSAELLQTYYHPDSQDMTCMRIRGYERIPGAVYKELVTSIRQYRNRNIAGRSKIDMSPYQIWTTIMKDPAMKIVEDINPIQNLKEIEIVTYAGEGGRGKDSMNKASRAYHKTDMGIVSEATVDSSDVGVNAYLSANPKFKNLRGIPIVDDKAVPSSSLISTSALLAPGSDGDDIKRVNFVSVQQGHTIATDGYHQPVIRTGYEYVIPNRTTDVFAFTAKQNGKVISVTAKGIIVEYEDGTQKGVTLGRIYGKAEGSVYPHDIVTDLKVGDKISKGDTVAYNSGFFERDFLDPSKVLLKNSMLCKVALFESAQTHEDSCAISPELSMRMNAKTTKVRSFIVDFKQNLDSIAVPGEPVDPKKILMVIQDEITSSIGTFDRASLDALKRLSNQAPKAGYLGVLDKIEVYYHGDKADMSEGLRGLADVSDKLMAATCKAGGKPVISGQVDDEYSVNRVPLTLDKAEVRFYITVQTTAGTGDKLVAANQMKSVIGEVLDYQITTEDGTPIQMVFGTRSILARVVTSPFIMGTTATLLQVIQKKAVEAYKA